MTIQLANVRIKNGMVMNKLIIVIAVTTLLNVIIVLRNMSTSYKLLARKRELDSREHELYKVENWLDSRECKLEKKLDKLGISLYY